MKYNNIIFLNATLDKNVHEIIDSSLIIEFKNYSNQLDVFLLKKRRKVIEKSITSHNNKLNINYHDLLSIKEKGAIHDLFAAIIEAWIILTKGKSDTLYIISFINMFSCHLINFISRITGKKILFCCHSELEVLDHSWPKNIKQYWTYLIKRFYEKTTLAKNLRLIILRNDILSHIRERISNSRSNHFVSIDHAYYSNCTVLNKEIFLSKKIKIGVIGSVSQVHNRGFNNLVNFANTIKYDNSIEIYIISKIEPKLITQLPSNVIVINKESSFIPRDKYNKYIAEMDYIYLPYPKDSFKYTASGAVLEAITQHKPILMYSNSYCKYLSKRFGDFGYFIDSLSNKELIELIHNAKAYKQIYLKQELIINDLQPESLQYQLDKI